MLAATLLALGSAAIHAGWNVLIKTSADRAVAAWGQFMAVGVVAAVGLAVVGLPGWAALPYVAGSAIVHVAYVESLVAAYEHGDFSLSYPLARGGGAVLAAVAGAVILGDELPPAAWVALAIAGAGLVALRGPGVPTADDLVLGTDDLALGSEDPELGAEGPSRGADDLVRAAVDPGPDGEPDGKAGPVAGDGRVSDRTAIGFALLTAACIASYTIFDSAGAREAESGVSYALASGAGAAVTIGLANVVRRSRRLRVDRLRAGWRRHLLGGAGSLAAYTMVLVAVRQAPVGYVTMLRESSVVLGALVGWLVLDEGLGRRRAVASVVILGGLVLLVAVGPQP